MTAFRFSGMLLVLSTFGIGMGLKSNHEKARDICDNLNLTLKANRCDWMPYLKGCDYRILELYHGNMSYEQKVERKQRVQIAYPNLPYNVSCECFCNRSAIKQGVIYSVDLPFPVQNTKSSVRYVGNHKYKLDISFPLSKYDVKYKAKGIWGLIGGTELKFGTGQQFVNCKEIPGNVECKGILDAVAHTYAEYEIQSITSLGICASKFKEIVTIYDTYGPPRKISIKDIGKDYVIFNFTDPKDPHYENVEYYLDVCQGNCKDSIGKSIGNMINKSQPVREYKKLDLVSLTTYSARVRYQFLGRFSNWTQSIVFTTKSEVPRGKPRSVKCKESGGQFRYLLTWKPPLRMPDSVVTKYRIDITEPGNKQRRVWYDATERYPYKHLLKSSSQLVDIMVFPCSESGCGLSFPGVVTCKFKTEAAKSHMLEIVMGVTSSAALIMVVGASLYIYRHFRQNYQPPSHRPLDGIEWVGPNEPYEVPEVPKDIPRRYVPVDQLGNRIQEQDVESDDIWCSDERRELIGCV